MSDIINLLPDSVANQIAAGEVIQRPASAIKELLENAIDSGADEIKLIIKDAGKTLIQVIDNGCGMSPTDARMSFERHATSKIKNANDLFNIQTMGFRGEALASIAAIAHVELKTKRINDKLGTQIIIEGTTLNSQNEVSCGNGSVFSIRNLFYNTPARRNFLKSSNVEQRHIQDIFIRVAIINPNIAFDFYDDTKQKFNLPKTKWKQRIIDIFGKGLNQMLLNVNEKTDIVEISGFIGKPETARKTRGEQYFFVNNRFIKHSYFNHAVQSAFEDLIPNGAFPSYFINLTINPQRVDINIHPTKTEVNFQDERTIYLLLRSAIKMTLGKFALSPSLDFESEMSFNPTPLPPGSYIKQPEIKVNYDYNPFDENSNKNSYSKPKLTEREINNANNWSSLYKDLEIPLQLNSNIDNNINSDFENISFFQIANKFICINEENGILIINRQAAHERILFDRLAQRMENRKALTQQKLFPETLSFQGNDLDLIDELWDEIELAGFKLEKSDDNKINVLGVPPELENESIQHIMEGMLEHYKKNQITLKIDKHQNILLSMAKNLSVKPGQKLNDDEIKNLIEAFFASSQKNVSPSGMQITTLLSQQEIENRFK